MVLVVTASPPGLRGQLTRWLLEIAPGVYVGRATARVRDELWLQTVGMIRSGRAIMVESAANEQGFRFRVHNDDWQPVDLDGLQLIMRPTARTTSVRMRRGWSKASSRRFARRSK